MWEIIFYDLPSGICPLQKFLNGMKKKNKDLFARSLHDIDVLQNYGNELRLPLVRQMGGGLYELRTEGGNNISRLFYFFYHRNYIVMTNGFVKKTQKTSLNELGKTREYKKDYERRHSYDV